MRPQPFLHELVSVLAAPTVALSDADGAIRADSGERGGVQGVLRADRRLLSVLLVRLDGDEPVPIGYAVRGAGRVTFTGVARRLGDDGADPTVLVRRTRTVRSDGLTESVVVCSTAHRPVHTRLRVRLATDLATMPAIKAGHRAPPVPPRRHADGYPCWTSAGGPVVTTHAEPAADAVRLTDSAAELEWSITVPPGGSRSVRIGVSATADATAPFAGAPTVPWSAAVARSPVAELGRLVDTGLSDLAALAMTDHTSTSDVFLGAGSPWFCTLFGRDSLWAARMLLPLGTSLAAGTLRTLARLQGVRHDERTGEAPGKIIHEVRADDGGVGLPPRYYGTIDATALWVCTLHDAWRWGMPTGEVAGLLSTLRAALHWLTDTARHPGDGFLRYVDASGTGLANQGWKDSPDAVQWPDGRIADAPIALCEAQAYAHQAVACGADVLDALGTDTDRDLAAACRNAARELRRRFRSAFWVADEEGRFPALALDAAGRPVPVASSNLGHLLGTGLLSADEEALVARRLAADDLSGARGLRTLSDRVAGANPLGYHTGSVWPHDTAIAVLGLARAGYGRLAARLADGLLSAAAHFDHRLPELFGGTGPAEPVLAYPAACRPQAWAAAAPVMLLTAAAGLRPDVPSGRLTVDPDTAFAGWFPLSLDGLRVAGHPLSVTVDPDGVPTVTTTAAVSVSSASRGD